VTSLKFLRFLKAKLETPYVVSCFFSRLLAAAGGDSGVFAKLVASVSAEVVRLAPAAERFLKCAKEAALTKR
jgi:hypothetical protein